MPKPITVEDYKEVSEEFFAKYNYVVEHIADGARAEDVIKIMQNLAGLVTKKRAEERISGIGFLKEDITNDDNA